MEEQIAKVVRQVVREEIRAALGDRRPDADELLTAEQAATALDVLPKTVREWARAGKLRARKHGSSWRFARSDVEAYRSGGEVGSLARDMTASLVGG